MALSVTDRDRSNLETLIDLWDLPAADPKESPNTELLATLADALDTLDGSIDQLYQDRFVTAATGEALDRIGESVGIKRKSGESDDTYRLRVQAGFARATSDSTFDDFARVVLLVLDADPSDIELFTDADTDPALVEVIAPQNVFDDSPFTDTEIVNQLHGAIPAGHRVALINEDTFQFYTSDSSQQTGKGFDQGKWS